MIRAHIRHVRAVAYAIENDRSAWRAFVATFLLTMGFLAYETVVAIHFLLTMLRR